VQDEVGQLTELSGYFFSWTGFHWKLLIIQTNLLCGHVSVLSKCLSGRFVEFQGDFLDKSKLNLGAESRYNTHQQQRCEFRCFRDTGSLLKSICCRISLHRENRERPKLTRNQNIQSISSSTARIRPLHSLYLFWCLHCGERQLLVVHSFQLSFKELAALSGLCEKKGDTVESPLSQVQRGRRFVSDFVARSGRNLALLFPSQQAKRRANGSRRPQC